MEDQIDKKMGEEMETPNYLGFRLYGILGGPLDFRGSTW